MKNPAQILTLCEIETGQCCYVYEIDDGCAAKKRLSDMGITKNRSITPLYESPFGNPRAYLVCGTVVALRNADACNIMVRLYEK